MDALLVAPTTTTKAAAAVISRREPPAKPRSQTPASAHPPRYVRPPPARPPPACPPAASPARRSGTVDREARACPAAPLPRPFVALEAPSADWLQGSAFSGQASWAHDRSPTTRRFRPATPTPRTQPTCPRSSRWLSCGHCTLALEPGVHHRRCKTAVVSPPFSCPPPPPPFSIDLHCVAWPPCACPCPCPDSPPAAAPEPHHPCRASAAQRARRARCPPPTTLPRSRPSRAPLPPAHPAALLLAAAFQKGPPRRPPSVSVACFFCPLRCSTRGKSDA